MQRRQGHLVHPDLWYPVLWHGAKRRDQSGPFEIAPLADLPTSRLLRFVQFPSFLRDWHRLGLDDEALRALERQLIDSPGKAPVMEHTGGLRKIRFAPPGSGRGRSGAYRVCFASFPS